MSVADAHRGLSLDIGQIIDDGPWTTMQKIVVILAALSIVADGFDGQLIGYAIPSLIKEWGVTRGDFAPVVASGLIGMGIGSARFRCRGGGPAGSGRARGEAASARMDRTVVASLPVSNHTSVFPWDPPSRNRIRVPATR